MKEYITLIGCLTLLGFVVIYESKPTPLKDDRPAPLKEGVIWKVEWSTGPNSWRTLWRMKLPPNSAVGGESGVKMTGKLYPTFLEIQREGRSRTEIVSLTQIRELEFGE